MNPCPLDGTDQRARHGSGCESRPAKVLVYETMRDIARRMWDKPPFLLGRAHRGCGLRECLPGHPSYGAA